MTQFGEPPKVSGMPHSNPTSPAPGPPPQISHETRRHSPAHPDIPVKIEVKTSPEQAKRRNSRLSAVPIGGKVFTFGFDLREYGQVPGPPTR